MGDKEKEEGYKVRHIYTPAQAKAFRRYFTLDITKFWDGPLLGFDIVSFDKAIETPDGVSCADHIRRQYGDEAFNLVDSLLGRSK
jgi:hypothetical protein